MKNYILIIEGEAIPMTIKELPLVGLGTWLLTDFDELKSSIKAAIDTGYQHIDTAQVYNNEYDIGIILKELEIDPSKLFLTTKVTPVNYQKYVKESVYESLRRLQVDSINLVLLHAEAAEESLNSSAYKELLELQAAGIIQHVGVSNFSIKGIQTLIAETGKVPYCNQIVCSPTTRSLDLEKYCQTQGIKLTGYSIIKPYFSPNPFYPESALTSAEKEQLDQLCENYSVSIAQLLNKWAIQHGYHVIPKSANPKRVRENFELDFEISETDMLLMDRMNRFTAAREWNGIELTDRKSVV